jgi:hypothetical protein
MPTFIKPGLWFKKDKTLKGALDLEQFIKDNTTPIVPITQTNYDALPQPINDGKLYVIIPE